MSMPERNLRGAKQSITIAPAKNTCDCCGEPFKPFALVYSCAGPLGYGEFCECCINKAPEQYETAKGLALIYI